MRKVQGTRRKQGTSLPVLDNTPCSLHLFLVPCTLYPITRTSHLVSRIPYPASLILLLVPFALSLVPRPLFLIPCTFVTMPDQLRHIAHFDLDSFFVAVEIINNPSLKGKAIIVGGTSDRGVVSTCSYEARKFGVHSAMPMRTALKLCPHAILLQGTRGQYSKYSRWVTDIIASKVPLFEKASIDEFYCDLTGMDKFFNVSKYTRELRELVIKETGLPISCGLSSAKFISKIATNEAKPNGFLEVPHGKEKEFLWPLQIEKINIWTETISEAMVLKV